ncbi:hypothetical protein MBLNU230_g6486t1 [Neophaeotheca triangularis]
MAAPTIDDLDALLASLNALKPPGASKNKISTITQLCVTNIQAELQITQSLYRAVKKAPATHKLGPIYIIDGVLRQWIELGKRAGQNVNAKRRDIDAGTYAAAIKRLSELTSPLMEDLFKALPQDQRKKVESILSIWEKGGTFSSQQISEFKNMYQKSLEGGDPSQGLSQQGPAAVDTTSAAANTALQPSVSQTNDDAAAARLNGQKFTAPIRTTMNTPPGFPSGDVASMLPSRPQNNQGYNQQNDSGFQQPQQYSQRAPLSNAQPATQAPTQDLNSILSSLSNMAQAQTPQHQPQPTQAPPPQTSAPPQMDLAAMFNQANGGQGPQHQQYQPPHQQQSYAPPQSAGLYGAPPYQAPSYNGYPPQPPPSIPQQYSAAPPPPQQAQSQDPIAQLRGLLPPGVLNDQTKLVAALKLLKDLQDNGVPMESWGPVIAAMDTDKIQNGRDRSRSPQRRNTGGRGSPVYGTYEEIAAGKAAEERSRNRNERNDRRFRQRSPLRHSPAHNTYQHQNNNSHASNTGAPQPKTILHDPSLPPNTIKVLSRTLFVGGASGTEAELTRLFSRFGAVQTCIVAREKRHAFVKMTTRQAALTAKTGMQALQDAGDREILSIARQTKWGVGFGPRECCDYGKGESIVPIGKLTEADLKWLHTAAYGGTGGRQLEGGMVLEEPDIEIGAGVSSKAMSKRVMPDGGAGQGGQQEQGGNRGGDRRHGGGGGGGRGKKGKGHYHNDRDKGEISGGYGYGAGGGGGDGYGGGGYGGRPEPVAVATPPAVPGFGFNFGAFLGGNAGGQR